MTTLGDVANLQAGVGFPPNLQGRIEGAFPFAKVGDISAAARLGSQPLSSARNYVSHEDMKVLKARVIPAGSTLFAKIGEAIAQNFRVMAGTELLIDNNAMAAIPRDSVDPRYLYRFLQTVDMYQMASTTSVPSLRKSDLERIEVPLPPLPEQRRIADILDRADDLRAQRRRSLGLIDSVRQATLEQLLSGALPKAIRLGDLVEEFRYGTSVKSGSGGLPVLRIPNVSKRRLSFNDLKYVKLEKKEIDRLALADDDLLIVRSNGNPELVGASVRFQNASGGQKFVFASYLIRARLREPSSSLFIEQYLGSPAGRASLRSGARTSAGQYNINTKSLGEISIPLPDKAALLDFAARVARVEAIRERHLCHLAKLDELFASLQHRAFQGEL